MATVKQVQAGLARFIDDFVAGAFNGWQKAVVVGSATLLTANLPNMINIYGSNPVVAAMGVYNPTTGLIDIDKLYNAFVPHMGGDKIPVTIPKIGTIKIGKDEIDIIVHYIKEA